MREPRAHRPHMPGYGIAGPDEGTGLMPWSWAEERLRTSHDYWVATVHPAGRPHLMPVWGIWREWSLWFSSGGRSRKTRNLGGNPQCVISTDNAFEPVVVEGVVEVVVDRAGIDAFVADLNRKYSTGYDADFLDPAVNSTFRLRPASVFGLTEDDFAGSPTRWTFDDG